jgi:hypothetical protein
MVQCLAAYIYNYQSKPARYSRAKRLILITTRESQNGTGPSGIYSINNYQSKNALYTYRSYKVNIDNYQSKPARNRA